MRGLVVIVHRWAGLFIAVFLFIAGLTGSVISWDHELDEWLNPDLFDATQSGTPLPPLELVARFEAANPKARVTYFPLSYESGKTAELFVEPRVDPATRRLYELDYNQAYLEPATGEVRGERYWGKISLDRRDLLPFLYKLHYSMHVPDFYGYDRWGIWLMGIVGIVWTFDCFVGLWLTFPTFSRVGGTNSGASPRNEKSWLTRWAPAWRVKANASAYRLNFDIHRAAGLWAWLFLLILAFTSISMNLGDEVVRPMLSKAFNLTPDVENSRTPTPLDKPISPRLSFASILDIAADDAAKRSWQEPLGSALYNQQTGIYSVSFFELGGEHGAGGMGTKTLYVDGNTGAVLGDSIPWAGTAADVFMQLQFPLHSGRIAGLPGRILLSIMGVVVATLSLTGIVIWFKKRLARARRLQHSETSTPWIAGKIISSPTREAFDVVVGSIHELANEERLRERLARCAQKATAISAAPGDLDLGRTLLLSGDVCVTIASVGLIVAKRMLFKIYRALNSAVETVCDVSKIFMSRGFWEGARIDVAQYARLISHYGRRLRTRGVSFAKRASMRLWPTHRRANDR